METTEPKKLSIGVIMDGNRRWAKLKGLPVIEGHRRGAAVLKDMLGWAKEANVSHVIVYAFSTENWKRNPEEIEGLFMLFRHMIREIGDDAQKRNLRVSFLGQRERFPEDMTKDMARVEAETAAHEGVHLGIALSYGGRPEILAAVRSLSPEELASLDEAALGARMWTHDFPDPDLIIRTGGERRLSNFLTWGSAYSELFFVDDFWPAFSREAFMRILEAYGKREKRLGA